MRKKNSTMIAGLLLMLSACGGAPSSDVRSSQSEEPPRKYFEPYDSCEQLAQSLIGQMTIEEKAGQMTQVAVRYLASLDDMATFGIGSMLAGGTDFPDGDPTAANWVRYIDAVKEASMNSRLGIPAIFGIDAVHGNAKSQDATVFPHNIGLGCTGDPDLVRQIGRITAIETAGSGVDWAFSPVLAAARDERWGRTYEAFGETPETAALYGTALIEGLQGDSPGKASPSVLACAKHFAGDGATDYGTSHMDGAFLDRGNVTLEEEEFRRLAVDQYRPAIEAKTGTVMISYSSYQGTKMHAHESLITDVLKGELGFEGFVVSDWKGIDDISDDFLKNVEVSINAGIDMVMVPDRYREFIDAVVTQVPERISEARVDDAVTRILKVKCEMGVFLDTWSPKTDPAWTAMVGSPAHRAVAREAVRKSLVVLKNDGGVLPLNRSSRIHVAGSAADDLDKQCGGWTVTWDGEGSRAIGTTALAAIRAAAGEEKVSWSVDGTGVPADAEVGVVVVGEAPYAEWRGDRADLSLDRQDSDAILNLKNSGIPVVVVMYSGRPMIIGSLLDRVDGWIAAWLPGTEGQGIADVLFGEVSPTGTLSHSWPRDMGQIPINQGDDGYSPLFPTGYGLSW